jgi:3-methyladenine DNA glycosylase/8-oxoguanine DNA glycosylase
MTAIRGMDPVLDALIERHGPARVGRPAPSSDRFAALVRSITYQQLAGRAAAAIHGKLVAALGGKPTPKGVLALSADEMAGCGLSRAKAAAITDLATHVASGALTLDRLGRRSDAEVVSELVQVRGIGRWTAEMFLLFTLGRLDIWPTGDYGVRTGFAMAWHLGATPSPSELETLGDPFRPYRSAVAWYCWRAANARAGAG